MPGPVKINLPGIGLKTGLELVDIRYQLILGGTYIWPTGMPRARKELFSTRKAYRQSLMSDNERDKHRARHDPNFKARLQYHRERTNLLGPIALHIGWSIHRRIRRLMDLGNEIILGQAKTKWVRKPFSTYIPSQAGVKIYRKQFIFYPVRGRPFSLPIPPQPLIDTFIDVDHPEGILSTRYGSEGVVMNWELPGLFAVSYGNGPWVQQKNGIMRYARKWHFSSYSIRGVVVPHVIVHRKYTIRDVFQGWHNLEVRRIALERLPLDEVVRSGFMVPIDRSDWGILYVEKQIDLHASDPMALAFVKVINATPEPDGHKKDYWLRVPPECRTAKQAVAWTFGLESARYRPDFES